MLDGLRKVRKRPRLTGMAIFKHYSSHIIIHPGEQVLPSAVQARRGIRRARRLGNGGVISGLRPARFEVFNIDFFVGTAVTVF